VTPTYSVLQTRRPWVWASLAVAAGLLIMVLQKGTENGANHIEIAQHDGSEASNRQLKESVEQQATAPGAAETDKFAKNDWAMPAAQPPASPQMPVPAEHPSAAGRPEMALDKLTSADRSGVSPPTPAAMPAGPSKETPSLSDLAADEATRAGQIAATSRPSPAPQFRGGEPATASTAPPPPASANVEMSAKRDMEIVAGKSVRTAAGAAGAPVDAADRLETLKRDDELREAQSEQLVVVHVVAKPEAIKNKSFDKLLLDNGLAIESEIVSDAEERAAITESRAAKPAEVERLTIQSLNKPPSGQTVADAVLVDAPKATIASCLAGLKNDESNYTGVDVQVPAEPQDRVGGGVELDKKRTSDWTEYNRGFVSQQQKQLLQERYYYGGLSYRERAEKDVAANTAYAPSVTEKAKSSEAKPLQDMQLGQRFKSEGSLGRARRLSRSEVEGREKADLAVNGGVQGATTIRRGEEMRRAEPERKSVAGLAPDNLRVLFVVSPEPQAAAGPPAEKAAK
jgi:hypothetical protein